ncbi:DUF447 domain-containing protein [Gimesia panareensis]|uniref:Uncharacterized protein n=1 Tax=Gimesia panareensis TaxID=2527978 RepID=A0A518A210_9PLAN|nr:DUF447 domain-containing protein [Gimesia panareensis]QDT25828.1 hypothetical protein Enr10x_11260 [Gimesia panareensis]QDU48767.1 hypothetical protein Pan110_10830 [Gimesia panareensis]
MILEGMVTSRNQEGEYNLAPMGPLVDPEMTHLVLRPFQTSRTFQNLKQTRCGVFHVVDDVLLLAKAAIGQVEELPDTFPAEQIEGAVLQSACRWYEFQIESIDESDMRTVMQARVVHQGRIRDYFGLNRAKHAVLEAAILATRTHLIPQQELSRQYEALAEIVRKTAGSAETEAFRLLEEYVARAYAELKS